MIADGRSPYHHGVVAVVLPGRGAGAVWCSPINLLGDWLRGLSGSQDPESDLRRRESEYAFG